MATVTAVRPPGRFGEMVIAGGKVTEFNEKPQATEGFINGGFFVLDGRKILGLSSAASAAPSSSASRSGSWPPQGQLVAYPHTGYWQPMDTSREYGMLNELWSGGKAPWKTW